jgi:hypothetical protein
LGVQKPEDLVPITTPKSTNQSINQPTNQPINQPINQSINQSTAGDKRGLAVSKANGPIRGCEARGVNAYISDAEILTATFLITIRFS